MVVEQLSKDNETSQLSAAIILRKFFDTVIDRERFRKETINVISSMLKIHPTGIYQKTLGDGLAYAGNLNYEDLQRTNLQDLYLGKKNEKDDELEKQGLKSETDDDDSWKITMDFTDMYGANLSYTLIENVFGFGTVFNSTTLNHTNIKNCSFRNADFKYADLTNVYFEDVILDGSDFKGAKGIPMEMIDYLEWIKLGTKDEAYVYKNDNPFTIDKTKKEEVGTRWYSSACLAL
ncbi:MAG: pentapeptide repeat-containing protein [Prevotella sp.]|nr:pentapeptide repeat-containing protein [Prevotella sp.]